MFSTLAKIVGRKFRRRIRNGYGRQRQLLSMENLEPRLPLASGDGFDDALLDPSNIVVNFNTNVGTIPIELFRNPVSDPSLLRAGQVGPVDVSATVDNFVSYLDSEYLNSIIHRLQNGFVIQGGRFKTADGSTDSDQISAVPKGPTILNQPGISNLELTIALARSSAVNSGSSEYFVNLANNTSLDTSNQGFTVFGRILDSATVDAITALSSQSFSTNVFEATLTGGQEVPAVTTAAEGSASLTINPSNNSFEINVFVEGFAQSALTDAHIHVGASGVEGAIIFDLGGGSEWVPDRGGLRRTISGATFPAANVTELFANETYVNIHTTAFPDGEIRGQLFRAMIGSPSIGFPPVTTDGDFVFMESITGDAVVRGVTYNDLDGDGVRDGGEPAIGGTRVFIDENGNGDFDGGEPSVISDATDGSYVLRVPTDGPVVIREETPAGFEQTEPTRTAGRTVDLDIGDEIFAADFGNQTTTIPIVEIEAIDSTANEEGPESGAFRVFISNADVAAIPASLPISFALGGSATILEDYTRDPVVVVLGSNQTSVTIDINPIDDSANEGNETAVLTVVAVDDSYVVGNSSSATVTIIDDDPATTLPIVVVEATDPTASEEGPSSGTFRIFISNAATAIIPDSLQVIFTVGGTAGESLDYVLEDNFVILGSSQTSTTIDITPIDDLVTEGNETVILTLSPSASDYLLGAPSSATVTIADNEVSSSLSGFVYFDENSNGTLDAGEYRIGGVEIVLRGPSGFSATQRTAGDGSYTFDNLVDGNYTIVEDPSGVVRAFQQDGIDTPGAPGGTANSELDQITAPLPANTSVTGNLFGEGGRVGGFVSKRDYLSSTPTELILAAVDAQTGAMEWFSFQDGWEGFTDANIRISNDRSEVTLSVTDDEGNTQTAIVDATDGQAIQFIGIENGTLLFSINGTPGDFSFSTGNVAPTAGNDTYSVDQDDVLTVGASTGVLDNDRDANGDALTASTIAAPANGDITLNANGSFTYTPDPGFNGTDSFTYFASDGTLSSNTARVTITVRSLVEENTFSVAENSARGTVVGRVVADIPVGDTAIFAINDPILADELRLAADDHLSGDPAAPVVLIEYLDFQ